MLCRQPTKGGNRLWRKSKLYYSACCFFFFYLYFHISILGYWYIFLEYLWKFYSRDQNEYKSYIYKNFDYLFYLIKLKKKKIIFVFILISSIDLPKVSHKYIYFGTCFSFSFSLSLSPPAYTITSFICANKIYVYFSMFACTSKISLFSNFFFFFH